MIDTKPRKNLTISPTDIAPSYVDSTFNEGSINLTDLIGNSELGGATTSFDIPAFHPGALGARTGPGEGGFAYAHTPEATIFIQKKEWVEQEWNYITSSDDERKGKNKETLTRVALANLISRKLDLLNDHELFTKFSELNAASSSAQREQLETIASDLSGKVMADILTLAGTPVTKYYTETISITEPGKDIPATPDAYKSDTYKINIANKITVNTMQEGAAGRLRIRQKPSTSEPVIIGIKKGATEVVTTGGVISAKEGNTVTQNVESIPVPLPPEFAGKYPIAEWWELDMASLKDDDLIPNSEALEGSKEITKELAKKNYKVGYVLRALAPPSSIGQLEEHKDSVTSPGTPASKLEDRKLGTLRNIFNGVIELANVTSIRTNNSIKGVPGSASITLENPNNILYISEDDIEIALGTRNVEDEQFDGQSPTNGKAIEIIDPITNKKSELLYYNGKYYTAKAFNLVSRVDLSPLGNFTTSTEMKSLKEEIEEIGKHIKNLQTYKASGLVNPEIMRAISVFYPESTTSIKTLSLPSVDIDINIGTLLPPLNKLTPSYDTASLSNGPKVVEKIATFNTRSLALRKTIEALTRPTELNTIPGFEKPDTAEEKHIRYQLRKYFQNRTIFEVYDRIFIWMSSPSKTTSRLQDGTIVNESSNRDASEQLLLRRIQEIISLIKQLNSTIIKIGHQQRKNIAPQFDDSDLIEINEELFNAQSSAAYTKISSEIEEAFNSAPTFVDQVFNAFKNTDNHFNTIKSDPSDSLDPTIKTLIRTIDFRIIDLKTFADSVEKAKTAAKLKNKSQMEGTQGLDPRKLLEKNSLAGLNEEQIQVFQGVITKISRNYSQQGKYTVDITCEDNLNFLERSRFIDRPGLTSTTADVRAFLEDPIHRPKDPTVGILDKIENIDDIVGRWKTGILTLTAQVPTESSQTINEKSNSQDNKSNPSGLNRLQLNRLVRGESKGFAELFNDQDPASIVSQLVTGIPFEPALFLQNAISTGNMNIPPKDKEGKPKDGEFVSISPAESTRQQLLGQKRKFGDFEPFLGRTGSILTKEDRDNLDLSTSLKLGSAIIDFIKVYVKRRQDLFPTVDKLILEQEKQPNTIYKTRNKDNINKLIKPSPTAPTKVKQIEIDPSAYGNDARLTFLIYAAISGKNSGDINSLITNLSSNSAIEKPKFDAIAEGSFVSKVDGSVVQQFITKKGSLGLISDNNFNDPALFNNISRAAIAKVESGATISILFDSNGAPNNRMLSPPPELSPDERKNIAALRGVVLSDKGEFVEGNPLQATKASIVFKHKPNYLVVDEDYVRNSALRDHVLFLATENSDHTATQYKKVLERCTHAAKIIDWEFFTDSQGHIRFKPPTYNRTLLRHMIDLSKVDGTHSKSFAKLFDKENLTKITKILVFKKYEGLLQETKIKALNKIKELIHSASVLRVEQAALGATALFGISTPPNVLAYILSEPMISKHRFREIKALLNTPPSSVVTIVTAVKELKLIDKTSIEAMEMIAEEAQETAFEYFSDNLKAAFNNTIYDLVSSTTATYTAALNKSVGGTADILHPIDSATSALSSLSSLVSAADPKAVAEAYVIAIEAAIDLVILCSDTSEALKTELADQGGFSNEIQNLTDEKYIHIIPSAIIIDESYVESTPSFTRLDVYSSLPALPEGKHGGQASDQDQWAGSVDYDLWRIYGYIQSDGHPTPFLSNSNQAVIYAHQLMSRQYSEILQGSITVMGDSKYQVGDTVFIEDENLYYYIIEVGHNFNYGSDYKTTLTLRYGRRPGHYIPYPFDILGARLISDFSGMYSTGEEGDFTEILDARLKQEKDLNDKKK